MWIPIPGLRSVSMIGHSLDPAYEYLSGGFGLFSYFPYLMSATAISDLYTYDHPPALLNSMTGPWNIVNAIDVSQFYWVTSTSFPVQNSTYVCQQCKQTCNGANQCQCSLPSSSSSTAPSTSANDQRNDQRLQHLHELYSHDDNFTLMSAFKQFKQEQTPNHESDTGTKNRFHLRYSFGDFLDDTVGQLGPAGGALASLFGNQPELGNVPPPAAYTVVCQYNCAANSATCPKTDAQQASNVFLQTYHPSFSSTIGNAGFLNYFNNQEAVSTATFTSFLSFVYTVTTAALFAVQGREYYLPSIVNAYLSESNYFNDAVYVENNPSAYIQNIAYYEPMLLVVTGYPVPSLPNLIVTEIDQYVYTLNLDAFDDGDALTLFLGLSPSPLLYIIPPQIAFQYINELGALVPDLDTRIANIGSFPSGLFDLFNGTRFQLDTLGNRSINTFTMGPTEKITQVNSVCNYRFEFVTNLGRSLVIGGFRFIDQIINFNNTNQGCQDPIVFSTQTTDTILTALSSPSNYPTTLLSSATLAASATTDSTMTVTPYSVSEGPKGYTLAYMEGNLGCMFAWRWHWIQTPVSYYMYNMIFNYDASSNIIGTKPTQAISLDMYNHSPLEQTSWMVHSLSITEDTSYSNTDTTDHSWQNGVSLSVSTAVNFGAGGGAEVPVSAGVSNTIQTGSESSASAANSVSYTYGNSLSVTQDDTQMLMANVPPHSKITANLLVFTGTLGNNAIIYII